MTMDSTKALNAKDDLLESCAALLEVVAEDAQKRDDTATWSMASVMAGKARDTLNARPKAGSDR